MGKKGFILLTLLVASFLLGHLKYLCRDGFRMEKVLLRNSTIIDSKKPEDNIFQILDKPFTYLGKGGQAYVFESQDKKHVLKLIRFDLLTSPFYRSIFPNSMQNKKKQKRFNEAIRSYSIAKIDLSEITGVKYVHLHKTNFFSKKLKLIDKSYQEYEVELDSIAFVLQEKVELLGDVLKKHLKSERYALGKELLSSYLEILSYRTKKGIYSKDHNFWGRNYGVTKDNKVLEIDVGSYRKDSQAQSKNFLEKNNLDHLAAFQKWLTVEDPKLASFFHEEIQRVIIDEKDII